MGRACQHFLSVGYNLHIPGYLLKYQIFFFIFPSFKLFYEYQVFFVITCRDNFL